MKIVTDIEKNNELKKKCINNFCLDSNIIIYTYVVSLNTKQQYEDNIRWIKEANQNKLVSQLLHFNIRQSGFFLAIKTEYRQHPRVLTSI